MKEFKTISLFCGAGGLDMGFSREGFDIVFAMDSNRDACKTYENWSGLKATCGNIKTFDKSIIPDADVVLGSYPCFTADSLIMTTNGFKKIVDIKMGDSVLGHDGQFHTVTNFFNQGKKNIYEFKTVATDVLNTTENHRFLIRKRSKNIFSEPEWTSAKEISNCEDSCYVGFPVNTNSIIPKWEGTVKKVNQFTNETVCTLDLSKPDIWYLAGRFVGDGWFKTKSVKNNTKEYSGIVICCGKHKVEKFETKLSNFNYTKTKDRTVFKYHFSSIELFDFCSQFGSGAFGKIIPSFVLDLPIDLLSAFLEGYFDADGCMKKDKNGNYTIKSISSVNKGLILELAQCVMKVYKIPCSVRCDKMKSETVIEGRTVNQHNMYVATWKEECLQRSSFYDNGYMWFYIHSAVQTDRFEEVYDIEVEDCHSFVVENCIAHNCQGFSLAGPRKIDDSRNILYKYFLEIVKEKQPKMFVSENVKGLLTLDDGKIMEAIVEQFTSIGYNVYYTLLNTKDFEVPQDRERVVIVGFRKDLGITSFTFPEGSSKVVTFGDCLKDLDEPTPDEICTESFSSRYMSRNRKRKYNEFSFTIPAMAKQVPLHPSSPDMKKLGPDKWEFGTGGVTRRLSYKEAAAVQTFPEDLIFEGNLTSKYKQIGNAVPVRFAQLIAKHLHTYLK